jgi:hypothetical protein
MLWRLFNQVPFDEHRCCNKRVLGCVAQFIAACRSSILAETLGYAASFSRSLRGKRRVFERHKPLIADQIQLSTNSPAKEARLLSPAG